ncbi:hypothetical protein SAMN04487972_1633 [Paracoccus halophilus]|uniref:Knr4/Smi1-like domain-containing protein n=2 Tax=Paracoccus halophilus TaxID=376733 RepID=A0A099EUM0_9RHOB|nr:hypothetical protein IT41_19740 [Paracoccus halophilus]SFA62708.1 hypothetical protein SAMN04487972_1633 [Paracoccus halophilus]
MTWDYYIYPEPEKHKLPLGFMGIGYAEPAPNGVDVVLNVDTSSLDYGKVYAWVRTNDPWMTGNNKRGLGFVADSFTEFMNNLTDKKNL